MKYLTLIRHAKSSWEQAGLADHDRPLNERGERNAPMVARFLARTYLGANGIPAILPLPDRLVDEGGRGKVFSTPMNCQDGGGGRRVRENIRHGRQNGENYRRYDARKHFGV